MFGQTILRPYIQLNVVTLVLYIYILLNAAPANVENFIFSYRMILDAKNVYACLFFSQKVYILFQERLSH